MIGSYVLNLERQYSTAEAVYFLRRMATDEFS
jgi:hypothetical protein